MRDEETIFNEARTRATPMDRATFLDQACAADPQLRQAVEALLAAHDRAGGILDAPPPGVDTKESSAPTDHAGTVIGRYKLLEQIGEGGMGTVFMAEQHHPVRRRVALKIIKPGLDTKQVIARFEAERQALAMMDHPCIAKVFDAGITDAGRSYFVMELVRGIPLTEYCDKNQLNPRQRLELFVQVCSAVQHAHQKGVIHRDLKPTNVLVTLNDGTPTPKIIDFGIAKATGGMQLTDRTLFTNFSQLIGTPIYMSPEQAEMSAVMDVDTRSDVYSLGVLLYELLTGTTPFDKKRLAEAAYDEVRRIIREEEPPRPSTRLSTLGETLSAISAQRQTDPKRLGSLVRGELDWIVMKALEKDRTRRYETANGLARDVQRYLDDQPVEACPPSRMYRLRKLARRNKAALVMGSTIAAVLVVATAVSTWQAVQATEAKRSAVAALKEAETARQGETEQRQQADLARAAAQANESRARTEAVRSEVVVKSWTAMLGSVAAQVAKGRDTTMLRESMDDTARRLDTDLKDQPEVEAEFRHTVGIVYYDVREYESAEAMFRIETRLRRQMMGDESTNVAKAMLSQADALGMMGEQIAAMKLSAAALAMMKRLLPEDDLDFANALSVRGRILRRAQSPPSLAASAKVLEQALAIQHKRLGNDDPAITGTMIELAMALQNAPGGRPEAIRLAQQALEIQKRHLQPDDPAIAGVMTQLGQWDPNRDKDDFKMLREAIAMTTRLYGPASQSVLQYRGQLARRLGTSRRSEAEAELRDVVKIYMEHPSWWSRPGTGPLYEVQTLAATMGVGRIDEIRDLYAKILGALGSSMASDDPNEISVRWQLATWLRNAGKYVEAEAELTGVQAVLTSNPNWEKSDQAADVLDSILQLAYLFQVQRKLPEAEAKYREAVATVQKLQGNEHVAVARRVNGLGNTLLDRRRLPEAEEFFRVSLLIHQSIWQGDDIEIATVLNNLGVPPYRQGRFPEAERLLRQSLEMERRLVGVEPTDTDVAIKLGNLGDALLKQEKYDEAEQYLRQALRATETVEGIESDDWAIRVSSLSEVWQEQGKWIEAVSIQKEALDLRAAKLGPDDRATLRSMNNLAWAYYLAGQYEQGLRLAEETVERQRLKLAANDSSLVFGVGTLAYLYEAADHPFEALDLFLEKLKLARERLGYSNPETLRAMDKLALVYLESPWRQIDAQYLLEESLRHKEANSALDGEEVATTLTLLGRTFLVRGEFVAAEPYLRRAMAIREEGSKDVCTCTWLAFNTRSLLGAVLAGQKRMDEAETLLVSGYEGMKQREPKIPIPNRKLIDEAAERLVQFYESTGKPDKAAAWRAKLPTTQPTTRAATGADL